MKAILRRTFILWSPVLIFCIIIYVGSVLPIPLRTPKGGDKVTHFVLYFIFGWLLRRAFAGAGVEKAGVAAFGVAFVYGVFIEVCQNFVPGRSASALDVVADGAGALLAQLLYPEREGVIAKWIGRRRGRG